MQFVWQFYIKASCHWSSTIIPVISDDQRGSWSQRNRLAILINLHPQNRILCGPQHWAVHVNGGAPGGGNVGGHIGDGGCPLAADQWDQGGDEECEHCECQYPGSLVHKYLCLSSEMIYISLNCSQLHWSVNHTSNPSHKYHKSQTKHFQLF